MRPMPGGGDTIARFARAIAEFLGPYYWYWNEETLCEPFTSGRQLRIAEIAAELAGRPINELSPRTSVPALFAADSLGTVEFILRLEDEFDVKLPDEVAQRLQTLADVAAWIDAELQKRPPQSAAGPPLPSGSPTPGEQS